MLGNPINYQDSGGGNFVFNDRAFVTLTISPFYYIQVESIDGLFGSDLSYESHPVPNSIGERSGDIFRRGKTITITGKIYGRDLSSLYNGAYFLYQMLADKSPRALIFIPQNFDEQLYITCRPYQDLSIPISVEEGIYRWSFTFGLRADDPRTRKVSDNSIYPTFQA